MNMARIEDVSVGNIVTQNGEYAIVTETNGNYWYKLIDEREYDDKVLDSAIKVCDIDEVHYEN
jgi:hypothetical protein